MPSVLFYFLKLSVAFAAIYLFYQFVLRRLTFYNWNRWYLIIYTAIAFLIPFINITPVLEKNDWSDSHIINWVPSIAGNTPTQNLNDDNALFNFSVSDAIMAILIFGALFLFARLVTQFFSFNQMKKKAIPFTDNGLTIYQVNERIIPFSFGNSIFINKALHSEDELKEIIRHEFIHVKQKHSMDIVWAELLCILNWYNPFVWLLKRSIRQNLEFIADDKVIENGIDKRQYQYLLLKVIGNRQFGISTQFNFSSLKKRIVMMNKSKSAKRQLARMLLVLPATAVLLLAFRNKWNEPAGVISQDKIINSSSNSEGPRLPANDNTIFKARQSLLDTLPRDSDDFFKRNPTIKNLQFNGVHFIVNLKNGQTETYNWQNKTDIEAFEKKYGKLPQGSESPKRVIVAGKPLSEAEVPVELSEVADLSEAIITEVPVKVATEVEESLVSGKPLRRAVTATVDIKDPPVIAKPKRIETTVEVAEGVETNVRPRKALSTTVAIAPVKEIPPVNGEVATITTDEAEGLSVEPEILLTITKKTTKEELESFKKAVIEKGFELTYDEVEFKNGILVKISGRLKSKENSASFSEHDFSKIVIALVNKGGRTSIQINVIVKAKSLS